MNYKAEVEGKNGIVARIVADSINEAGNRITTFELEYHRYIHSEIMTHRLFSRNAMSSRAIPVTKMIEQVRNNPATPIHWGKNKAGMQAEEECNEPVYGTWGEAPVSREEAWTDYAWKAAEGAEHFSRAGYHKQIVNRLLEPFQRMKTVLTATEFNNFFWLRRDNDAQPEIHELADCMFEAMKQSQPELLKSGEYHTPYVEHFRASDGDAQLEYIVDNVGVPIEEALAISSSCCAQVSYRSLDNSYDKAIDIYKKLLSGAKVHASPFEHQATPMKYITELDNKLDQLSAENTTQDTQRWEKGITHVDRDGYYWSGNFKGFIQYRQTLKNHVCWEYDEENS